MAFNHLAVDDLRQIIAKNVLTQHADDHRGIRIGKSLIGPVGEPCKIVDESGLDLIFGRWRILRKTSEPGRENQEQSNCHRQCGVFSHQSYGPESAKFVPEKLSGFRVQVPNQTVINQDGFAPCCQVRWFVPAHLLLAALVPAITIPSEAMAIAQTEIRAHQMNFVNDNSKSIPARA
jgi:hypothetical protein